MKSEQIYFDVDGTIVEYHKRFYKLYKEAYISVGEIPLDYETWINLRRNGIHPIHKDVREKVDPYFVKYFEDKEYLKYDIPIPGMIEVVKNLQEKYPIKFVSFRSNNKTLLEQLESYEIYNAETIIQGFSPGNIVSEKASMILKVVRNPSGWIIGDTEYEITAGQKLDLKTIAVTWGDRSKEFLQKYNPDFIVDSSDEILKIIQ